MASAEKYYVDKAEENGFQDKITKLFTQRMSYRIYNLVSNACDEMAVKCNSQLFREEAGEHKQLMDPDHFIDLLHCRMSFFNVSYVTYSGTIMPSFTAFSFITLSIVDKYRVGNIIPSIVNSDEE